MLEFKNFSKKYGDGKKANPKHKAFLPKIRNSSQKNGLNKPNKPLESTLFAIG